MSSSKLCTGSARAVYLLLGLLLGCRVAQAQDGGGCPDGVIAPDGYVCVKCPDGSTEGTCMECQDPAKCEELMTQQWVRWGNGLMTEPLLFNALLTNPQANALLAQVPLRSESFQDYAPLASGLYDAWARKAMYYLVSCALAPGQQVQWVPEGAQGSAHTWHGEVGLCPEWNEGLPDEACLERVSSCMLARNNPAGVRVRISLRGGGAGNGEVVVPEAQVTPDMFKAPRLASTGVVQAADPILSFAPCDLTDNPNDCGWSPVTVGRCTPGEPLRLFAQAASQRCGTLRACEGSRGCDAAHGLAETKSCSPDPILPFTCPASGLFSVMSRMRGLGAAEGGAGLGLWDSLEVKGGSSSTAKFLSELELFPNREAGFYGKLIGAEVIKPGLEVYVDQAGGMCGGGTVYMRWQTKTYVREDDDWYLVMPDNSRRGPARPVVPGAVYRRRYVCSDPQWVGSSTELPGRVCALADAQANCAAKLVGNCVTLEGGAGVCESGDGPSMPGDRDFQFCQGGGVTWQHPLTTFMYSTVGGADGGRVK